MSWWALPGQEVGELGREVEVPVDEHVGELVEAEEDRRDGEADPQQPERLHRRIGEIVSGGRWVSVRVVVVVVAMVAPSSKNK